MTTAEDPAAGLPEEPHADDWPDLELCDPADREVAVEARIADARAAEAAARATDARIGNSEGSQVGSGFSRVAYGDTRGFLGEYDTASHSLFSGPLAQDDGPGSMQRDYWLTSGRKLADLESPEAVGRAPSKPEKSTFCSTALLTWLAMSASPSSTAPTR